MNHAEKVLEQRVRTEAGWIGVEISRSRVRTPGKAGYGLYRVRPTPRSTDLPEDLDQTWTAYAFMLEEIRAEVEVAISAGIPVAPSDLWLRPADGGGPVGVTTRWTSAYRGRRDLGVPEPVALKPEFVAELDALAAVLDAGLVRMRHDPDGCHCADPPAAMSASCVQLTMGAIERWPAVEFECLDETEPDGVVCHGTVRVEAGAPDGACSECKGRRGRHAPGVEARSRPAGPAPLTTVRQRQRAFNAAFQEVHAVARDYGLRRRHAAKLARVETQPPETKA